MFKRFSEFYSADKFTCSIEVFPPKTPAAADSFWREISLLREVSPEFVSVTYGAMGSTRELTQDLAVKIFENLKVPTAFHFTCVGSGRDDIKNYVLRLLDKGMNLVVALRGDRPKDANYQPPVDGFHYAHELVSYLKSLSQDLSFAVAGYPEKHVEAVSFDADLGHLAEKVRAGADVILTQLFFDNRDYFSFVKKLGEKNIHVPVVPGILAAQSLKQVEKLTGMVGAKVPNDLRSVLTLCGDDEQKSRDAGIEFALQQCRDLKKNGAPGIHFYTLNRAEAVMKIVKGL